MQHKKIGVLGGMGPEASARFYSALLACCQKQGAIQDTDYPAIVLYSLPVHGFDETGIVDTEKVLSQLIDGLQLLERAGCEIIAMPCNTIHLYFDKLQSSTSATIISIVEQTVQRIKQDNCSCVSVLSSETTRISGLYTHPLQQENIDSIITDDSEQTHITNLILEVMGGEVSTAATKHAKHIIDQHIMAGAQAVVLGCTELPLALTQANIPVMAYDSITILAEATIAAANGNSQSTSQTHPHRTTKEFLFESSIKHLTLTANKTL